MSSDSEASVSSDTESVSDRRLARAWGDDDAPRQTRAKRNRRSMEDDDDVEPPLRGSVASKPLAFTKPAAPAFSKAQNAAAAKSLFATSATVSPAMPPPILHAPPYAAPRAAPHAIPLAKNGIGGSVAAKYMAKFGFSGRLGKDNQGIAAPIEVMVRPEGAGLGMVEEASALPENRANTEHLERMRLEAEAREARERQRLSEAAEIDDLWRRVGGGDDVAPLRGDEDKGPAGQLARAVQALQSAAQIAEEAAARDRDVAQGLISMHAVDQARAREELARIHTRLHDVDGFIQDVMRPLAADKPSPALLRRLLRALVSEKYQSIVQDCDLRRRVCPAIVHEVAQSHWDDADYCLDVVDALDEAALPVEQAVVRHVLPRLASDAKTWDWDAKGDIHLLYLPWLPHVPGARAEALEAVKDAVEQRLHAFDVGVDGLEKTRQVLGPWKGILDDAAVQRLVARAVAPRLADAGDDVAAVVAWFKAGLLGRLEAICVIEGGRVLASLRSDVAALLASSDFAAAARRYERVARALPRELLVDAARKDGGNRLRLHLDVLLESMEAALDARPVRAMPVAVPVPRSFGDALRSHANASVADEKQAAPLLLMREALERFAEAHGVVFMASGTSHAGKKVYAFGSVPVYVDDGVVYAKADSGVWAPVSLEGLLQLVA